MTAPGRPALVCGCDVEVEPSEQENVMPSLKAAE